MKRLVLLLLMLFTSFSYTEAVEILGGPSLATISSTPVPYSFNFSNSELGKSFLVSCSGHGYIAMESADRETAITITPNSNGMGQVFVVWKTEGQAWVTIVQKDQTSNKDSIGVTVVKEQDDFDLDPGYSGDPLVLSVSKTNPKQFENVNISLEEHYVAVPIKVEWNIDGVVEENELMSNSVYFPTTGTKTVSAKIYFDGTSETKTISKTVTVSAGTPDLAGKSIIGPTTNGVGGDATYHVAGAYSTADVEYHWTSRFGSYTQEATSEYFSVYFPVEGVYTIMCQAEDKRTGMFGSSISLRVTVTEDGEIMKVDEDLFTINLINKSLLRIEPIDKESLLVSNNVQYRLCSLTTGLVVQTGYVNKDLDTSVDVSALRKGIYVLYIQMGDNAVCSYKFSLN